MRKMFTTLAVAAIAVAAPAGIASAEGTIEVDPSDVDAAGEQDVAITLSGFTADLQVFVLPCDFPSSGNAADLILETCDQTQLSPVTIGADGGATLTATYDIPAEGLAVFVTDAAEAEQATALITVGGGDDEGDGTAAPTGVDTGSPLTGSTSVALLAAGIGMLALSGGALTARHTRRERG